jgi:dextranase
MTVTEPRPELLPELATFPAGREVRVEVRDLRPGTLCVRHLGEVVAEVPHDGHGLVSLGALTPGGYGVEAEGVRTALDVQREPRSRLRYGFVASFPPGRDPGGVAELARRLHLTAVQLYDWAYRHADLLGGGEEYVDPLGRPVSLPTVRALAAALRACGADPLGYAAVYAVGEEEWARWSHLALLRAGGEPWSLGTFLRIVDPAHPEWLEHLAGQLRRAVAETGLAGFHLDQYGYPRRARRADGARVDVAESFATLLAHLRAQLPAERLVFNQVNDFPTWRTAHSPQDAVYIEPWHPQDDLGDLARTVERARRAGKPVVLAAYQSVYRSADAASADTATALTMATLFSHGATQLLAGEEGNVLVDPYYVDNHPAEPGTLALLRRWYDFLVEHDELLMGPQEDVTTAYVGPYNDECDVVGLPCTGEPTAGAVWRRVVQVDGRLVVHLVNLLDQPDARWDAPRAAVRPVTGGVLRIRRVAGWPRVRVADPDGEGYLRDVPLRDDGEHVLAELPPLRVWQLVLVDPWGEEA